MRYGSMKTTLCPFMTFSQRYCRFTWALSSHMPKYEWSESLMFGLHAGVPVPQFVVPGNFATSAITSAFVFCNALSFPGTCVVGRNTGCLSGFPASYEWMRLIICPDQNVEDAVGASSDTSQITFWRSLRVSITFWT